jgi:hypothetical protein
MDAVGEYDPVVDELDRIAAQGNGTMRRLRAWRKRGDATVPPRRLLPEPLVTLP